MLGDLQVLSSWDSLFSEVIQETRERVCHPFSISDPDGRLCAGKEGDTANGNAGSSNHQASGEGDSVLPVGRKGCFLPQNTRITERIPEKYTRWMQHNWNEASHRLSSMKPNSLPFCCKEDHFPT